MRSFRFVLVLVLIAFAKSATAQQAATPSPQATALLQQALTAVSGGHALTDVTLSGTARRIAGSDDESGTAVLKALAAGASRTDLTLPGGNRSEVLNTSSTQPAQPVGAWSGPDGVSHPVVYHNLLTAPAWFFPAFPIANSLSTGYVAIYVGHETRNGQAVEHLAVSQASAIKASSSALSLAHLSQVDFFLDSTTFLPAAITFSIHPDDNALLDIPVEIDFSNYTTVSGSQVPFHIQKHINNSLALDLQFESAVLNSGLSVTAFAVGTGL
jgi:hypothetical protein